MYPVNQRHSTVQQRSGGEGVRGRGEVQGGGAVDELPVGLSKRGQAKGRKTTNKKFSFLTP
jgi:hypothetical protein